MSAGSIAGRGTNFHMGFTFPSSIIICTIIFHCCKNKMVQSFGCKIPTRITTGTSSLWLNAGLFRTQPATQGLITEDGLLCSTDFNQVAWSLEAGGLAQTIVVTISVVRELQLPYHSHLCLEETLSCGVLLKPLALLSGNGGYAGKYLTITPGSSLWL